MVQVVCEQCETSFQATRSTRKFCSNECRQRAKRTRNDPPPDMSGLLDTVRSELVTLGKVDTVHGQQALIVAARMTSGKETGSAVTSLSQELTRLMAQARAGAASEEDEVTRARRIRDEKRHRAFPGAP